MTTQQPYVIVRCSAAGVHAGYLVSHSGQEVKLRESRRLWYWRVPMGAPAFLSGVATHGITAESKVGCPVTITVLDACEIIECTDAAQCSIEAVPTHVRAQQ